MTAKTFLITLVAAFLISFNLNSAEAVSLTLLTRIPSDDSAFAGDFHPSNPQLYLVRTAKSIKLIDVESKAVLWSVAGDGFGTKVLPVLFDLTGDRVFVADLRGSFRVLSVATGEVLSAFYLPVRSALNYASDLKINVKGDLLYAVDREVVYEFSLTDYLLKRRFVTPKPASEIMGLFVTGAEVKTLDNNRLTTWLLSDSAAEPQPSAYARIKAMIAVGHADRTSSTKDGSFIMLNGEHRLVLLDMSGTEVRNCTGFVDFSWSSRSLNAQKIVSVHKESVLKIWDVATCTIKDEIALTDVQLNDVFPFGVRVARDESALAVTTRSELLFYKVAE